MKLHRGGTRCPNTDLKVYGYLWVSDLIKGPLGDNLVVSAFANRDLYLVLANYGNAPAKVKTPDRYVPLADPSPAPKDSWDLLPRSLQILRRQRANIG